MEVASMRLMHDAGVVRIEGGWGVCVWRWGLSPHPSLQKNWKKIEGATCPLTSCVRIHQYWLPVFAAFWLPAAWC